MSVESVLRKQLEPTDVVLVRCGEDFGVSGESAIIGAARIQSYLVLILELYKLAPVSSSRVGGLLTL